MKETWKHRDVFETYLLMGPGRSLKILAEQTGASNYQVHAWSNHFKWKERLEAKDQRALEIIEKDNEILYVETVKRRQQNAYKKIQESALKHLEKKTQLPRFESDKDAAIAMDIGIKGERQVLGLSDSKLKGAIVKEGFAAFVEAVFKDE